MWQINRAKYGYIKKSNQNVMPHEGNKWKNMMEKEKEKELEVN